MANVLSLDYQGIEDKIIRAEIERKIAQGLSYLVLKPVSHGMMKTLTQYFNEIINDKSLNILSGGMRLVLSDPGSYYPEEGKEGDANF